MNRSRFFWPAPGPRPADHPAIPDVVQLSNRWTIMNSQVDTPDWSKIPAPTDDGAARHLTRMRIPSVSDGMRTWRLAGGRRHLGWLVPIFCALICPTPEDVQAGPPGGDPVRDRVVALVGRLGGEVRFDEQATGPPIVEIRLRTTRVADDQLGELRGLSSLRTLDLTQTRISDAGLARLRGHEGLRSLLVYDTRVTDRGLEHIATMSNLEKLLVGSCDVSGPGLSHLASLAHLKELSLIELDLTDSGLTAVAKLAHLEELDLVGLKITDAGLAHVRGLSRLRRLALDGNEITDAGLAHLVGLTDLEELSLKGTRVTDAGLVALQSLPHLRRLKHDDTKITAAGLDRLRHLDRTAATDVTDRPQAPEPRNDPGGVAKPDDVTPDRIRAAVAKALPPLQKGLNVYAEKRDCFSCHNQAVPLVALEIARGRGFAIDEEAFEGALALTLADLESALGQYRKGRGPARRGDPGGLRAVDARSRRESRR